MAENKIPIFKAIEFIANSSLYFDAQKDIDVKRKHLSDDFDNKNICDETLLDIDSGTDDMMCIIIVKSESDSNVESRSFDMINNESKISLYPEIESSDISIQAKKPYKRKEKSDEKRDKRKQKPMGQVLSNMQCDLHSDEAYSLIKQLGVAVTRNFGYVFTNEALQTIYTNYEMKTSSSFILYKTPKDFSQESLEKSHYIFWEDRKDVKIGHLEFDGVPFIILGQQKQYNCHHGPLRGRSKPIKCKQETQEFTTLKKVRCRIQSTKKIDCPAKVIMKHVVKFPDFKISSDTRKKRIKASMKLREAIKNKTADGEKRLYIYLPMSTEHTGHVIGEAGSNRQNVDKRILQKIADLAENGVKCAGEIKAKIQEYVIHELFEGQIPPSPTNRRFFPHMKDLQNTMYRINVKKSNKKYLKGAKRRQKSEEFEELDTELDLKLISCWCHQLSDEEFLATFRVTRILFQYLVNEWEQCKALQNISRIPNGIIPGLSQICVLIGLYYLGTSDSLGSISTKFQIKTSRFLFYLEKFVCFLLNYSDKYLNWPSIEIKMGEQRKEFGLPGVFGAMDAALISFKSPPLSEKDEYALWRCHSTSKTAFVLQFIVDYKLIFRNICINSPVIGSRIKIFQESDAWLTLQKYTYSEVHIVAPSVYPLTPAIMTPHVKEDLSDQEILFNELHNESQNIVYEAMTVFKSRFKRMQNLDRQIDRNMKLIKAACILHNIALMNEAEEVLHQLCLNYKSEADPNGWYKEEEERIAEFGIRGGEEKRFYLTTVVARSNVLSF